MRQTPQPNRVPVGIGWRHPHYRELLQRQPALDFLEVHSENFFAQGGAALAVLRQGRASYPISLHGVGLSLGSAIGIDDWHLDQLARLVQQIEPVRVSDHACFARGLLGVASGGHVGDQSSRVPGGIPRKEPGNRVVHASDLLPIPFSTEALDVLCANVQRVQDRLKRPFMVENLSAYVSWTPAPLDEFLFDPLSAPIHEALARVQGKAQGGPAADSLAEPAFLAELARRTGCALLVDVNNIYVNALNAQMAGLDGANGVVGDPVQHCLDWLDAIPPASVGELHLAGHSRICDEDGDDHRDIVIDDHGSRVCDAVWRIYRHAVQRFGPVPTLVEWDTDVPELDVLLEEVDRARSAAKVAVGGAGNGTVNATAGAYANFASAIAAEAATKAKAKAVARCNGKAHLQ